MYGENLEKEAKVWFERALVGMVVADGQIVEQERKLLDQVLRRDDLERDMKEWDYLQSCLQDHRIPELPELALDEESAWHLLRMLALVAVSDLDLDLREEMYLFKLGGHLNFSQEMIQHTLHWALNMTGLRHPRVKHGTQASQASHSPQMIAVLWRMAPAVRATDLLLQAEQFIRMVKPFNPDLVAFPDFFSDSFLRRLNTLSDEERRVLLGRNLGQVRERMMELAQKEDINIYAGNLQLREWKSYFDLMVLCRRDGSWEDRVHASVAAEDGLLWQPESALHLLRTDIGRIGVLPHHPGELDPGELIQERELDLLLVPSWPAHGKASSKPPIMNQKDIFYAVLSGRLADEHHHHREPSPQVAIFNSTDAVYPQQSSNKLSDEREARLCASLDLDLLREYRELDDLQSTSLEESVNFYEVDWFLRKPLEPQS